jgi:flagellar biogenesis protein FliO
VNRKHVRKTEGIEAGGLALWLLAKWRSARLGLAARGMGRSAPRLALVERITLGSRQTLALVEAEGRRFLVASSAEGAPAFLALDSQRTGSENFSRVRGAKAEVSKTGLSKARISW